jgi:hypothetical protein
MVVACVAQRLAITEMPAETITSMLSAMFDEEDVLAAVVEHAHTVRLPSTAKREMHSGECVWVDCVTDMLEINTNK